MKRAALSLAALTLCAVPAVAQAQQTTPPPQQQQQQQTPPAGGDAAGDPARAAFETGLAALQDERYADALASFEQSYRIRRVASVALNLGITLRALGRLVEARQRFEEFMALASPALHERYDRDVTGYLGEIARRVGHVHLTAIEPSHAVVTVDDRRAMLDADNDVLVDPGEHRVEADAPGYAHFRQVVRVDPGGRAEVSITLATVPPGSSGGAGAEHGGERVNGGASGTQPTSGGAEQPQQQQGGVTVSGRGQVDTRVALTPAESAQPAPGPIYTRPVFWGAVIGVLVVGGVVAGVVAATRGTDPPDHTPSTNDWVVPAGAHF